MYNAKGVTIAPSHLTRFFRDYIAPHLRLNPTHRATIVVDTTLSRPCTVDLRDVVLHMCAAPNVHLQLHSHNLHDRVLRAGTDSAWCAYLSEAVAKLEFKYQGNGGVGEVVVWVRPEYAEVWMLGKKGLGKGAKRKVYRMGKARWASGLGVVNSWVYVVRVDGGAERAREVADW